MSRELDLWRGEFGDEYTDRNELTEELLEQRKIMWSGILGAPAQEVRKEAINSNVKVLEVGANVGVNLVAINKVMNRSHTLFGLEPNDKAKKKLIYNAPFVNLVSGEAADINATTGQFDLVFTSGVLIHMNDEYLKKAMDEIYRVSSRWIAAIEYFSAEPRSISYRGVDDFIYLREYGSLWLNNYPLRCLGYAFMWKRVTKLDNLTWWLFEKVH
jgi:pseudaminic acid biosynthesis-associated methylase